MRRSPDLEAEYYVQEHQDALQLRTGGDRGRDTCRLAAVRAEGDGLQQAVEEKRSGLLRRGRRYREDFGTLARLARNHRAAKGSGGRGRQGESALGPPVRGVIMLSSAACTPFRKG